MAQQITYGTIQIIVGRATVRDDLHAQTIHSRLEEVLPQGEWYFRSFGDLCAHVRSSKGLGFDPAIIHGGTKEQILEAYNNFLELDKALKTLWEQAIEAADAPVAGAGLSVVADPN